MAAGGAGATGVKFNLLCDGLSALSPKQSPEAVMRRCCRRSNEEDNVLLLLLEVTAAALLVSVRMRPGVEEEEEAAPPPRRARATPHRRHGSRPDRLVWRVASRPCEHWSIEKIEYKSSQADTEEGWSFRSRSQTDSKFISLVQVSANAQVTYEPNPFATMPISTVGQMSWQTILPHAG